MHGWTEVEISSGGTTVIDDVYAADASSVASARVDEWNPAHAVVRGRQSVRYRWPGQTIELTMRGQIESGLDAFNVNFHVAITIDDLPHFNRHWTASFPRRLL